MRPSSVNQFNTLITRWIYYPGDDEETLVLKKVWWAFVASCFLFPGIEVITAFMAGEYKVAMMSTGIVAFCLLLLLVFHFHRKNIEAYALAFQLAIVFITSLKTFLTGGLIYTAGVAYVGMIGPVQAVIFPNRRRALMIFLFYQVTVIASIFAQPYLEPERVFPDSYFIQTYITKFVFGTTFVFFSLDYFTHQLRRMKAEEARRLKAVDDMKTQFYTDIAHEFRTPLSIMLGMAEQVRREPGRWLEEGTTLIRENGRRLMELTNQILDLSKLDARSLSVSPVQEDIVAYTLYIVESFHALAEKKKIKLSVRGDVGSYFMDFDPDKLQTILSNLLSNALRYTPERGSVEVWLRVEGEEQVSPQLLISVRDTGIGIPRHLLSRVFDRYFQVHQHQQEGKEGTGLGLAITKELVQLLGGSIRVESTEGQGTAFTLQLPITRQAPHGHIRLSDSWLPAETLPTVPAFASPDTGATPRKPLSLLLVEDNPDFANYLHGLLDHEYVLNLAGNGEEGLVKALAQVPDLIISDVMMPKLDGITMCNLLKNDLRTSHIPIILLTAKADLPSRVDGLIKGADAYITKPFDRSELMAQIHSLIETRRKLQEYFRNFHSKTDNPPEINGASIQEAAFLRRVQEVMELHVSDENFGIAQLCRDLGMSRTQLYRKFQALTDTTAHQYLLELRLQKAHDLLKSGQRNVTEVALETGFRNLSHFSKAFKQLYGVAPRDLKG